MVKIQYIQERLSDTKLRDDLSKVVADVDALIPQSEEEFSEVQKFGLYPAEQCVPFVTRQGTPFYQLDNMAMIPEGDTANYLRYGDFAFRQLEVLYIMARMDNAEAHNWLRDNLFRGSRVDARKKNEYKAKFRGHERVDWKTVQVEWMKYCLNLKYRCNALFRKDLFDCKDNFLWRMLQQPSMLQIYFGVQHWLILKARSITLAAMYWANYSQNYARIVAS